MQTLIEMWSELPPWLRATLALVLMAIGAGIFLLDDRRLGLPIVFFGTGLVLLCCSGPSDSEKKGYRF